MTTATPDTAREVRGGGRRGLFAGLQDALARPLSTYYLLLGACTLLLVIGLIMVLSASSVYSYKAYHGDSYAVLKRQALGLVLALPFAWWGSRVPERTLRSLAWVAYVGALLLLLVTKFIGVSVAGNQNWLAVGPVQFQPSELGKLALVLWGAHVLAGKDKYLDDWKQLFWPVVPGFGMAALFVMLGNDLGTAVIFVVILIGILWVVGTPIRVFAAVLLPMGAVVSLLVMSNQERTARFLSFLHPFAHFRGVGWQPAHGLYALATGSWLGQGIGASQQKWGDLAAAHTDYIFAVIGEELGLVGTLFILGLFFVIAFAAVRVALRTQSPFVRYFTAGVVVWIVGQMMINIGMVLTLLPVVGVPLPLVSYGGSSLIPTLIALGVVIGFARREPEAARALAQRRRNRSAGLAAR